MKLSDATQTLHEGHRLFPVESLKQVQEMLWVDFSEWNSDDEELSDVRAAGITSRNASAQTPRVNAQDDACVDTKDVPEHLQALMEWIAEDISTRKCEDLAAAIYEYRDVLSSGQEDVGQTDLLIHTIDTGEHRPICLPPRQFPITQQDGEKAEIQKMFYQGVIKPCQSSRESPVFLVTKKEGSTRFLCGLQ